MLWFKIQPKQPLTDSAYTENYINFTIRYDKS